MFNVNKIIMKKIILSLVAALMVTGASAQFNPGTFSIQPQIGVGFSNITGVESEYIGTTKVDKTMSAAVSLGAEAEYQFTKNLSFAAGLNYAIQGCGWEDVKQGSNKLENPRIQTEYIKIPVMANFYLTKGLAIKAGVQCGFLTAADVRYKFETKEMGHDATMEGKIDFKDEFESFDFSIPMGVSYETKNHWVFDARYQLGLTKVNKEGDENYKNSVFMVTIGKKFKF